MPSAARHAAARLVCPRGAAVRGPLARVLLGVCAGLGIAPRLAAADDAPPPAPSIEQIAEQLLTTTVTVRGMARPSLPAGAQSSVAPSPAAPAATSPDKGAASPSTPADSQQPGGGPAAPRAPLTPRAFTTQRNLLLPRVNPQIASALIANRGTQISVSSGVSLGDGLIVTFSRLSSAAQYRLTLPDGEQAQATLLVQDLYSGLCLLKTDAQGLPALKLATSTPAIGAWLMTAAAAGIDRPLVSQGIVGGVERVPRGTELPPLLQCDLRTTETSCGSPVVDREGKLVGIVAAVSETPAAEGDAQAGWTFVVPARHIARLLAVRLDQELVVLQRQRPVLGLTLVPGAEPGTVRIEQVERGGSAAAAGIRAGDWVVETDGRKIRSPYQVMSLVQRKQPGERIEFVIMSGDGQARRVEVTLASALPEARPAPAATTLVEPKSETRVSADHRLEFTRRGKIAELGVDLKRQTAPAARDQQQLLLNQLKAFEQAILQLRAQLKQRDEKLTETDQRIEKLNAEIERLRSQMPPP
ncbi:MAG: trypsin-like peptidase domain-containing protein [Planctomycetaceae bacterium]|nr:trypsin-like peptidase domain-containing protein [Planctomycetaceae bacterium]